jgi:hypothetical protein
MTRKLSTLTAEPLGTFDILDGLDEIKRISWAIAAAVDGVVSQEPGVEGVAHICTILIERIEALEQQTAASAHGRA